MEHDQVAWGNNKTDCFKKHGLACWFCFFGGWELWRGISPEKTGDRLHGTVEIGKKTLVVRGRGCSMVVPEYLYWIFWWGLLGKKMNENKWGGRKCWLLKGPVKGSKVLKLICGPTVKGGIGSWREQAGATKTARELKQQQRGDSQTEKQKTRYTSYRTFLFLTTVWYFSL